MYFKPRKHSTKNLIITEPKLFQNEAETISFYMIEKIISLTISKSFKNQIDHQLNKGIFSYIKSIFKSYISSQFISIDKDDENRKMTKLPIFTNENEDSNLYIKKTKTNLNSFNILNNNEIPFIDLSNIFYSNYFRGENKWNVINEPKNNINDRYCSSMINYIIPDNTIPESKLERFEDQQNLSHKINRNKYKIHFNKSNIDENDINKRKKLGEIMNKFSFHDLPKEDFEIKEIDDIKILRQERKDELKKKEIENKLKIKNLIKKEEQKKEETNFLKQYENKKLTIDPNGNIVFIKSFKVESLSNEFLSGKSNMKILKIEPQKYNLSPKKKQIKEENEEKENEKSKSEKKENKLKKNSSLPKLKNNQNIIDSQNNIIDSHEKKINFLKKKMEKGPITPSGSCFDKINLEIGVSMKEDKNFKTGGKDFFIKYKKYSIDTFNKQLKDTVNSNSFLKTQYNEMSNIEIQKNLNSSLDNNTFYNNNNFNNTSNYNTIYKKNNLTTNNFLKNKSEMNLISNLNPLIKLNGINSLRTTINDLDLSSERGLIEKKIKRINIFKEKIVNKTSLRKNPKNNLTEMNMFTSTLLSNEKWKGSHSNGKKLNPLKVPIKPLKMEIEREMGKGRVILRKREMHNNIFSQSMRNFGSNFRSFTKE